MSKLAAICAKLKGDAVTVNGAAAASPFDLAKDDADKEPTIFSSPEAEDVEADDAPEHRSPSPTLLPTTLSATDVQSDQIGVLKRKSIMPTSSGASRRKKHRPAAASGLNNGTDGMDTSVNSDWQGSVNDDCQSLDGSEHSLHIDLPEESPHKSRNVPSAASQSHHKHYSNTIPPPPLHASPGVLQALGLTLHSSAAGTFDSAAMASQSLAALAQQASSYKEEHNSSRVESPASLSGDSLNDSNSRVSLVEKLGSSSAGKKGKPLDHSKYLARYLNAQECGSSYCIGMNYREHFHCLDCTSRIIVKKEEMIRHYKWHKKREDSLQHGFMRYSPFDDCMVKFGPCAHNKKQTHYHCIQAGCNKVYVSTSDVQMHANYHRKASAIIMEGFQRFRATEDCGTPQCDFYSQRTTHFHCRRQACNFTFKNKADMEKHKTYHQKDEILAKDGFKKYMKYEHCPYSGCAYSKLSNHIHCMRPDCQYVLHSTSQLYPHKRKHEKKEADSSMSMKFSIGEPKFSRANDAAAGYFKPGDGSDAQQSSSTMSTVTNAADLLSTVARLSQGLLPVMKDEKTVPVNPFNPAPLEKRKTDNEQRNEPGDTTSNDDEARSDTVSEKSSEQIFDKSLNLTPGRVLEPAAMNWKTEKSNRLNEQAKSMMGHFKIASSSGADNGPTMTSSTSKSGGAASGDKQSEKHSELWRKYLTRYTANDPCNPRCWLLYKDHYHCNVEKCFNAFKNKDGVRDHARLHDNQEKITEQLFTQYLEGQQCGVDNCAHSGKATHYHCKWMGCAKTLLLDGDIFARLDHFQEHEFTSRMNQAATRRSAYVNNMPKNAIKKRGRPPKTASSFPGMLGDELNYQELMQQNTQPLESKSSYSKFDEKTPCLDELCKFRQEKHYHCDSQRCYNATNRLDVMQAHSVEFHNYIQIPENYAYFDRNVNCRGVHCSNNRNSCHYHCLRPGCEHSFIRHTTVAQHDKRHNEEVKSAKSLQKNLKNFGPQAMNPQLSSATDDPLKGLALINEIHRMAEAAKSHRAAAQEAAEEGGDQSAVSAANSNKTVKASGTFFPQSGKPEESANGDAHDESSNGSSSAEDPANPSTTGAGALLFPPVNPSDSIAQSAQANVMLNLLTQMILLQQKNAQLNVQQLAQSQQALQQGQTAGVSDQADDTWQKMLGRMYASPKLPCGNVFCKKKQLEHYHCLDCGTAFNKSHESRLKSHMIKHGKYAGQLTKGSSVEQPSTSSTPTNQRADAVSGFNNLCLEALAAQRQNEIRNAAAVAGEPSSTVVRVGVPDSSTETAASSIQDMMMKALQLQMIGNSDNNPAASNNTVNSSANPSVKEEPESGVDSATDDDGGVIPKMYKWCSKESDCGYERCTHSKTCDHYHCLRDECSYSVSEESRLPQHTKRHEKLDKIMGDDFRLYKQKNECGRADCEFSNKASHFHCLLCPYICTDASRIMPHRKNHGASPNVNQSNGSSLSVTNESAVTQS